jgi:hypothetical protein
MPWDDEPVRAPVSTPGLPAVTLTGPGSRSGWQYTPALGRAIAELYADGCDEGKPQGISGGLWGLHHAMPEYVPPPTIVRAWCKQFPAFGLLLREAERLRAERLMEETLVIADNDPAPPPRVALKIAARQHYAERLDRARYGTSADASRLAPPAGAGLLGVEEQPTAVELDDAQLMALAAAGVEGGGQGG